MLSSFPSTRTQTHWRGITNPAFWLLLCFASTIITLIITIIINATVSSDGHNDYSAGTGWTMMLPMPIIALLWTLIDLVVCRFTLLHPIHALVMSLLLALGYAVTGAITIAMYEWDTDGSWAPGVPMLFTFLLCTIYMSYAARAIHAGKKMSKSDRRMSNLQGSA
nr:hypothetical protein B0A51_10304 [Rachicladosporium sp. CCFEE 5018]